MTPDQLWTFLPLGYALTVALELPVLLAGLHKRHAIKERVFAGVWLTACTYPVVVLVLPMLIEERTPYLIVAEVFAPAAECGLFLATFGRKTPWRDCGTIIAANLLSFLLGGWLLEQWSIA